MRELTASEKEKLQQRKTHFDSILEERLPCLVDFMERLGFSDAPMVLAEAENFLPALSRYLENQEVTEEDRNWLIARLAYFAGEYLVQRLSGCWLLNEIPDSRYFLCIVVGAFTRIPNRNAMVDPFLVAAEYVDSPTPRDLARLLGEIETELVNR